MKIYLGADHAGFELKEKIKKYLIEEKYNVVDCGNLVFDKNDDYPDFISRVAENVSVNVESYGIALGKSGAGECIVANKFREIRAILAVNENNVRLAREHNDANVISIGSEIIDLENAKKLINIFLKTPFSADERHIRRINKIKAIENKWN
jgi:ribose 5-phosphate isomerase B